MRAVIDIGTILVHAALAAQQTKIVATNKSTGKSAEFKNVTEFWGGHHKKDGGVLARVNAKRLEQGRDILLPDDFEIETITSLVSDGNASPEAIAFGRLNNKIEAILTKPWCTDYIICHGVGENFRYEEAHTQPYKANRTNKPILLDAVKEYLVKKYKNNILVVDGVEDDDAVTQLLWEGWMKAKRNHNNLNCYGVFCDKDILQTAQLHYNFDKPENGLVKIDSMMAAKAFAVQLIKGDNTDTIPSVEFIHEDIFKKYSIRKTKGVGDKTASALFETANTIPEVFSRVCEVYKLCYGEEKRPFASFRGEEFQWNWLDHLNERFQLLKLRTDVSKPVGHVSEFMKRAGVSNVQ